MSRLHVDAYDHAVGETIRRTQAEDEARSSADEAKAACDRAKLAHDRARRCPEPVVSETWANLASAEAEVAAAHAALCETWCEAWLMEQPEAARQTAASARASASLALHWAERARA